jgi:hypothetical protein
LARDGGEFLDRRRFFHGLRLRIRQGTRMSAHSCCQAPARSRSLRASSALPRIGAALEWVIPGAIFVAIPKCPACVAAYIALATGVGVSLSTAANLRTLALTLCLGTLACFVIKRAARLAARHRSNKQPR